MVCLVNRKYLTTDCVNYQQRVMLVIGTILIYSEFQVNEVHTDYLKAKYKACFPSELWLLNSELCCASEYLLLGSFTS